MLVTTNINISMINMNMKTTMKTNAFFFVKYSFSLLKLTIQYFKKNLSKNLHWDNFYPKHQSMEESDIGQVFAAVPSPEA